ncbi:methionyl-tRNA synthetase [Puccinia graminis f. sp. tritici CRL 75-36-700-3]|uniref:Methionyl-tRNA synthetase n=1 Tax=Puccinia graminis f. sp. tritici (strain CRL 75-36-700-3 / race SCCL) TaxID=418459 RepID=E3KZ92_PUCGT|nr:methionyl-tRNA synthetase [Puccinia graminis f. sp. tritici CRL 75-36-700-3]EFP89617.1 methionyl-tRNA synthetase [Puccinia graminis f. sp. tritici CRL 75-36-700-3]
MSKYSLSYPSTDVTTRLVVEVFLKPLGSIVKVEESSELSLQQHDVSTTHTQLPAVLRSLSTDCKTLLADSDEEKETGLSWVERLTSLNAKPDSPKLKELDDYLQSRTFMIGTKLSAVDIVAYTNLHSYMSSASQQDKLQHPSVTRHFDFIQNISPVRQASEQDPTLALVQIDVTDVPEVERKAAVPEKKEKKAKASTTDEPAAQSHSKAPAPASGEGKKVAGGEKQKANPEKKEKKKGGDGGDSKKAAPAADGPPMPHMIDMRVGKIIHVEKHPDADSLYVEKIDFGEPEPRTVVSGLVNYIPIEEMRDRLLVGICNLKPANMRGVKSFAMVLAATSKDGKGGPGSVELVAPPPGSEPGDRIYFEGFENHNPIEQLNPKKKQFETIQPNFTTLDTKEACWTDPHNEHKAHRIMSSKGVCCAPTFVGASLS